MSTNKLQVVMNETLRATAVGAIFGLTLMVVYLAFEPVLGRAVTDEFVVTQQITGEISFSTAANDVTMAPAISSLTGGTSTGATQVVVSTNSATGYTMDIQFASGNTNSAAMEDSSGNVIPDLTASGTPVFTFSAPVNSAAFGYSVEASTTADVDPTFLDNGSACNTGAGNTADRCWMRPYATTSEQIVNVTSLPPVSGSTSTVKFQLVVNANPSPAIPAGFYYATATLTALTQ